MTTQLQKNNAYWNQREAAENVWIRSQLDSDEKVSAELEKYYNQALSNIQKEISQEYLKYGATTGQTYNQALSTVSAMDVKSYKSRAAEIVQESRQLFKEKGRGLKYSDFSEDVNKRLKLYNATMRINKLEMLKSKIGLEMVNAGMNVDAGLRKKLTDDYQAEIKRQSGILGKSVNSGEFSKVLKTVMTQTNGATYSQRVWANQDALKAKLDVYLAQSMIQGQNPRVLAKKLIDQVGTEIKNHAYVTERIARTESARVEFAAEMDSFKATNTNIVRVIAEPDACHICKAIVADGKGHEGIYNVKDAPVGPYHPNCRCSLSAWYDPDEYEKMLDKASKGASGVADFENEDLKSQIGETNYKALKDKINSSDFDPRLKSVLTRYQDKFKFDYKNYDRIGDSSESENYNALTKKILAYKNSFTGNSYNKPLQAVFHEMGHAVDNFATKDLLGKEFLPTGKMTKVRIAGKMKKVEGSTVHISSSKEYDLAGLIKDDLNNTIYSGIPSIESLGPKPRRRGQAKTDWYNNAYDILAKQENARTKFIDDFKQKIKNKKLTESEYGPLSDILESTKDFGEYPFKIGHGKRYWNNDTNQQTEFVAHMTESLAANPKSLEIIQKYFPSTSKAYFDLLEDIAKKGAE